MLGEEAFNSHYWLGRVGSHPVLDQVHGSTSKAKEFVDRCARAKAKEEVEACQTIQTKEFEALLSHLHVQV